MNIQKAIDLLPVGLLVVVAGIDAWFAAVSYNVLRPPLAVATVALCLWLAYRFGKQRGATNTMSTERGQTMAVMHVIVSGLWRVVTQYNLIQEANTELGQHGVHLTESDYPADDPREFSVEVDGVVFTDSLEQMTEEMQEAVEAEE